MLDKKRVLAIIPARAGSKRVINKNSRELCGLPLIAWTLKDLRQSAYIDDIFVSTDSKDIQNISQKYSIACEPLRSPELSTDVATSASVVIDVIEKCKDTPDMIVLLQPTSPLRSVSDIDKALELFATKNAKSVVSVCKSECHPSWISKIGPDLKLDALAQNIKIQRSQELEVHYKLNGAIYISSAVEFCNSKTFFHDSGTFAYLMAKNGSVDIDTEEDFIVAEAILRHREKHSV